MKIRSGWNTSILVALAASCLTLPPALGREDDGWVELCGKTALDQWKPPTGDWVLASKVGLDPRNDRRLSYEKGLAEPPILVNGPIGRTRDIVTRRAWGDVEVHAEFYIPKGSNSGIKLNGLYEVQIADSHGIAEPKAMHCGGVYPRAELLPKYHYLDEGHPPRLNAAKPAGEWQTLDIVFRAPRFDAAGKKTANARFDDVTLNGKVIHHDLELATPTGHAWSKPEPATGPILLQGDHGPVAFRSIRARPLPPPSSSR